MKFSSEAAHHPGLDHGPRRHQPRAVERVEAVGRHGHLRCRGPGPAGGRDGTASQEGDPRHLGRQRHQQRRVGRRAAHADSRERRAGLRAGRGRHHPHAPCRRSDGRRRRCPRPGRFRGRAPAAAASASRRSSSAAAARQRCRTRENGSTRDALRQMTDDTGGRTEIVRGFGGLDERHRAPRRRTEQAVLPGLRVHRTEGRPLAQHPRGGPGPQAAMSVRAAATSRRRTRQFRSRNAQCTTAAEAEDRRRYDRRSCPRS